MESEKYESQETYLLQEMLKSLEAEARLNGYDIYESKISWRSQWARAVKELLETNRQSPCDNLV